MRLHLASGCHEGETSTICPTLFSQIEVLEAWIDTRSVMGRAVIVDGDLVWTELDDGDPYPLHVAGAGIRPQCDPRYGEFIDFLVLKDHALGRKIQGSSTRPPMAAATGPPPLSDPDRSAALRPQHCRDGARDRPALGFEEDLGAFAGGCGAGLRPNPRALAAALRSSAYPGAIIG